MSEAKAGSSAPKLAARPMSPHLQVWRWHITMLGSILHRATGMALYVGAMIIAGWAAALAGGPESYGAYKAALGSPLGKLVLFGLTFSVFYHLANGLRHIAWDLGFGFTPRNADMTGAAVIAFAAAATVAVWVIAILTGAFQ